MSKLAQMQARFQQKQMAEKEEKMLKLYETQQQRVFDRVGRSSAGSEGSFSNKNAVIQAGKVRQMFDERRQKAGIDRSYPLEPIKATKPQARGNSLDRLRSTRNGTSKTTIKTTVQKSVSQVRNGKPIVNRKEIIQGIYNNNGGEETYEEHMYSNDNDAPFYNTERDLVALLNTHNLNDNLDDEELPNFGIDECDDSSFPGKLSNVGGRLPTENGFSNRNTADVLSNRNTADGLSNRNTADGLSNRNTADGLSNRNTADGLSNRNTSEPPQLKSNGFKATGVTPLKKETKPLEMNNLESLLQQHFSGIYESLDDITALQIFLGAQGDKPPSKKPLATSVTRSSPSNSYTRVSSASPLNSPKRSAGDMSAKVPPKSPAKTPPKPASSAPSKSPSATRPSARTTNSTRPGNSTRGAVTRDDLVSCKFCTRRFAEDRLQIHEDICARTAKKKRKQYDATRHRLQGTELEPFTKKGKGGTAKSKPASGKKTDWRRKHEEFIAAIRAAKVAQQHVAKGGKLSDLPPPPPSLNPDYVQCPHCGRRFNETAAERHIPKCSTYLHNKNKSTPGKASGKR